MAYYFNAQFPPLARVCEPFEFQFAPTTFQPDPDSLQYSVAGNPPWLSFSAQNRTLWGTPGAGDVGSVALTITAAGQAGAVATMPASLQVANSGAPSIVGNVSAQLSAAGALSGPDMLVFSPSKSINIQFSQQTFAAAGQLLTYFATLADHTPLPSWLTFDGSSLQFTGTTPQLSALPQAFDIALIASTDSKYAAAVVPFRIVVSNHQLVFQPMTQIVNATKGNPISVANLRSQLFLDSSAIADDDVQSAVADVPPWLSFDPHSFAITGTPPSGLMSQNVTVNVMDRFGDNATSSLRLVFKSELFNGAMEQLNVVPGEAFQYGVPQTILAKQDDSVAMDFGPLNQWLHFDPSTFNITGTVPVGQPSEDVQGSLKATSATDQSRSDSQTFNIHISAETRTKNATAGGAGQPAPTGEANGRSHRHSLSHASRAGIIAGLTSCSILLLVMLFLGCVWWKNRRMMRGSRWPRMCIWRRNRKTTQGDESPQMPQISRPIMYSEDWEDVEGSMGPDLEKADDTQMRDRTPEHAPRLEVNLPMRSANRTKDRDTDTIASSIGDGEADVLMEFNDSPWGFQDGGCHTPHDSMKLPTEMARRSSGILSPMSKAQRRATNSQRESRRSTGLPVHRCLTGHGHGRLAYSPSRTSSFVYRRRRDGISFSSHSTQSTLPSAFPQTLTARHTTQLTTPLEDRRSLRIASSACSSIRDRTLDERRQSYIRKRASTQSPFFAAASSRASSSSYKQPFLGDPGSSRTPQSSPLALEVAKRGDTGADHVGRDTPLTLFPGSLRKPAAQRSFATKHAVPIGEGAHKPHERSGTAGFSRPTIWRSGTRDSLGGQKIKPSLGSLRGSKISEDAMSESIYSAEVSDEDFEKQRDTVAKQGQFSLSPLRPNPQWKSRRESGRLSRQGSSLYSLAQEHGGKENTSSSYMLALPASDKGKAKATSSLRPPELAKPAVRPDWPLHQSQDEPRAATQPSSSRHQPPFESPFRAPSHKSHHSHRSRSSQHSRSHAHAASHSHTHSRGHSVAKSGRDRSRPQSSAYPHLERPVSTASSKPHSRPASRAKPAAAPSMSLRTLPKTDTASSLTGTLPADPSIHEFADADSSAGALPVRPRAARLAILAERNSTSPATPESSALAASSPVTPTPPAPRFGRSLGFGLRGRYALRKGGEESPGIEMRTPLAVVDDASDNHASPGARSATDDERAKAWGKRTWGSWRVHGRRDRSKAFI